jgi:L-fuculose-phosphate aldolase
METFAVQPIGILHCDITSKALAPKNYDISDEIGTIEIRHEFMAGLEGINKGDVIVVLFWLHKAERDILKVHPRGDTTRSKRGVFSTRSPVRPNPIAISELKVEDIRDNLLTVSGLDILDQTPVIDIKSKVHVTVEGK